MNPARRKVPYPICGISSLDNYLGPFSQAIRQHRRQETQPHLENHAQMRTPPPKIHSKEPLMQPLTTTRQVMSIYEHSRTINNEYSEIDPHGYTLNDHHHLNQGHDPSAMHFKILELIQENSKLIQLLSDFDQEIGYIRDKLRQLQEEYMRIAFSRAIAQGDKENSSNSKERSLHNTAFASKIKSESAQIMDELLSMRGKLQKIQFSQFLRNRENE